MSPVLPHSAPIFTIRRRPVRRPVVSLLPFNPVEPNPRPEAGALAQGEPGRCKGKLDSPTADCPPPQLQIPRAPLVGIAHLAAQSLAAETKRQSAEKPEYFLLPVKSILNRCDSDRVPFEWTINPYRGCEFACKYCYARYTHEYMEIDGGEFEKKIFVKQDAAALLGRDVSQKYSYESKASGYTQAGHIAIGTATDPYQPAEREYGVTRACLEELARREGLSLSIITKSNQIVRDIDILKVIASKSALTIDITVTTLKPRLGRLLEPRAPRPDLRLSAVKELREVGLHVGVTASPVLPGITDGDGELERVAEAAKAAGAEWFFSGVLFLMSASAKQFLPFVREKFPRLAKQYDDWYRRDGYAPEEYRRKVSERMLLIRQKFGFAGRPWEGIRPTGTRAQLSLGWDAAAISEELQRARSCTAG
ncbi:MAG TPA: radical SAM protein [Candidatus Acidoferrum sp.]|nr:radical SAM protein [Candidatus Acidoferrum sp.]